MRKKNYIEYGCFGRWYGFDLDGTIADNTMHGCGMGMIGKPIKPMCSLMKRLHKQGKRVKIVTARLNDRKPARANPTLKGWDSESTRILEV